MTLKHVIKNNVDVSLVKRNNMFVVVFNKQEMSFDNYESADNFFNAFMEEQQ